MLSGEYEMRSKKCARENFGVRWQPAEAKRSEDWSAAATPLFDCGQSFQSGVPECFRGSRRSPKRFGCGYAALGSLAAISTAEFSINGLPMICKFS